MNIGKKFGLAERHRSFSKGVWEKLKRQSKEEIEAVSTKEARIAYNWNKQVAGCYQRSRAFSRLKISKHGIVYGQIEPEHFVEDLVSEWFLSRFPMFTVVVGSKRGTFLAEKNKRERYEERMETVVKKLEKKMPENELLKDLVDFNSDEFWENYYSSQMIKERKNRKYFLKNIPKKFHDWESLSAEKKEWNKNKRLDEF